MKKPKPTEITVPITLTPKEGEPFVVDKTDIVDISPDPSGDKQSCVVKLRDGRTVALATTMVAVIRQNPPNPPIEKKVEETDQKDE